MNPESTETKRLRQWEAQQRVRTKEITIPALDMGLLTKQYGPESYNRPHRLEATFTSPLDASQRDYELTRNHAVERFIAAMAKQGWDISLETRMEVRPGIYPARDLVSGDVDLGRREYIIVGAFSQRHPKFHRIELPPEIVNAMTIHADGSISYED